MGARRHPRRLRGAAPDLGLRALRGADHERDPPRAGDGGRRGQEVLQRPGGLHARRRLPPRRDRGARVLDRRGVLRPRPRRRGRHRQDHGEWIVDGQSRVGRLAARHRAASAASTAAAGTPWRARTRPCRSTTTSSTRARSERPAGRCASRRRISRHIAWTASLRREVRLGARQLVRVEHSARRRRPAAARMGRQELVACDRGRGARRGRSGALFDQSSFSKLDVLGPGALRLPRPDVREHGRPAGRHRSSTRSS